MDSIANIPGYMGCGVFGNQILFLGGFERRPLGSHPTESKSLFVFDFDNDVDDSKEGCIKEMHRSRYSLARFDHGKIYPLLVELNGDLYAMGFYSMGFTGMNVSEVYRHQLKRWETLPEPPPDFHKTRVRTIHSYAITGNKIVVSKHLPPDQGTQVIYYDADRNSWITRQPHNGFKGTYFPFPNEGLVVDLEDGQNKEKVLFSFHKEFDVRAWRFRLTDNLDDSYIEPLGFVRIGVRMAFLLDNRQAGDCSHCFVNLGYGKVCFIRAKSILIDESIRHITEVRLIVIVFEFDMIWNHKPVFSSRILTTRTFTYESHCPDSYFVHLISCFVR